VYKRPVDAPFDNNSGNVCCGYEKDEEQLQEAPGQSYSNDLLAIQKFGGRLCLNLERKPKWVVHVNNLILQGKDNAGRNGNFESVALQ
jgi:hypothetical protein